MNPNAFDPTAIDPTLDLVLDREVAVAPELVWRAWTTPELLVQWFAPRPWETPIAEIELFPGGTFRTVMRSPEGEEHDGAGCVLQVVENELLTWTAALGPGFRPHAAAEGGPSFTASIVIEPAGLGTRYRAIARHADPAARAAHDEMGFVDGWGTCLDQLVELMSSHPAATA